MGPEEGVISAARAAVNWNVPQFGPWGLSHASAFGISKGKVEGALMVQTVLPNIFLERNSAFLRNYTKLSKETPIGSMMSGAQTYDRAFSPADHDAISANMLWLGTWRNQERAYFYKEDERRATIIRRKEAAAVVTK